MATQRCVVCNRWCAVGGERAMAAAPASLGGGAGIPHWRPRPTPACCPAATCAITTCAYRLGSTTFSFFPLAAFFRAFLLSFSSLPSEATTADAVAGAAGLFTGAAAGLAASLEASLLTGPKESFDEQRWETQIAERSERRAIRAQSDQSAERSERRAMIDTLKGALRVSQKRS